MVQARGGVAGAEAIELFRRDYDDRGPLAAIRALLGHVGLDNRTTWDALGIVELRRARRISVGKFMNFTRAEPIQEPEARAWPRRARGRRLATLRGRLEAR